MPRGLEALIPKKKKETRLSRKKSVFWIEIDKIKPNPFQPRKEFNKKDLKELANSIEKYGILQPLLVKKIEKEVPTGERVEYQLIAGERRLRAAKMIGMKQVPVIIEDVKRESELPISLVENIQREDLNPLERARAFKRLIKEFNLTQKEIGKIVGKSREAISNTLRLLELPEEIKKGIEKGEISEGHARAILSFKKDQQVKIFREIVKKKLPVREVERRVASPISSQLTKVFSPSKLQEKIAKVLGIRDIKVRESQNKIKLTLTFSSKKELERFLSLIKK